MHMLSKRDSSSEELDTLRRSRTPTVVLTANGEVHTNEEAQENDHDLDLFVTVQLLEETPAVPSLGKLCDDLGYSYEWVSGQKPRLTKQGKKFSCKTDNFVPLVVPGLSSSSDTSSSSTSLPQDSSSTSSSPATERSDEPAPGNWRETNPIIQNQHKNSNGNQDSDDRLRDLPEWLEEFADNLEDTEVSAPAHISQDSGSERTTKVVSKSRKHSIYSHFPKDRNCEVCL